MEVGTKGVFTVFNNSSFSNSSFDPSIHSDICRLDFANRFSVNITSLTFGGAASALQLRFETNTIYDHSAAGWTAISVTDVPPVPALGGEIILPLAKVIVSIDTAIVPATPNYAGYEWQFRMTSPFFRVVPRVVGAGTATLSMEVRRMLG